MLPVYICKPGKEKCSLTSGYIQLAIGPDGKKKEPESNVLLASIENMQYAVTVDVLHTVFSAFGTVQKIAIFEKNGGMQALVQYPDVTTAAVAKEALEGHCIYDGGYCKLHLSYSRHTDLNVKAHSDRSRDYTISESGLLAMQQASSLPTTAGGWQSTQATQMFPGNEYTVGAQAQVPNRQLGSWDPSMQAERPTFVSSPSTFPGQTFVPTTAYSTSGILPGASTFQPPEQGAAGMASQRMTQYARQPNVRPAGAPPTGQHPYYGQ
ncbi:hypothetical protein HHK36_024669 [Tetracentron sinense]|uniref:PTBP1-like RNA recognition motif 2 domain-containing protein n=1 Tax=Tetracentron sinense TaxID=13715 RepID=A0A834YKP6_TETSI|nr:hypothetical protein HHK36_024669 [Tetracentron sinense]